MVEAESFIGASKIQDLKEALGQYDIYRYLLEETAPDRKLYIYYKVSDKLKQLMDVEESEILKASRIALQVLRKMTNS